VSAVFLAGLVVAGRRCVVFGEDLDASARARELAAAGAEVVVVAERAVDDLEAPLARGGIRWVRRAPRVEDADGAFLVVSTVRDDESWSAALFDRAIAPGGPLLCCIDQPAYCTFTHVASVRRGPMQIGIATDGAVPLLASRLRLALDRALGPDFTAFVDRLATLREATKPEQRRAVLEHALEQFRFDAQYVLPPPDDGGRGR
jgi:siroheme synthase-like protein